MELVVRFSPSSPTLGLLCESQVCDIGVSIWVCSISKEHQVHVWCNSHVLEHRMPPVSSQSQPEMVSDQEYPKVHTNLKICCFYWVKGNFIRKGNEGPSHLPAVLCLWSQARPWGIHPAAINGDVVPSFTIIVQAARLVPQCIHKIYNGYDKQKHLQPSF
jgi:hypothetical protein